MTILEFETEVVEHTASIDPVFNDDHWVCCDLPDGFVGITISFCGKSTMQFEPEYGTSVGCGPCNEVALCTYDYCPIKEKCTHCKFNEEGDVSVH